MQPGDDGAGYRYVAPFAFLAELPAAPAAAGGRICDACGNSVRGFVYHSDDPDLDLHPCCTARRRAGPCGERSGRRRNLWAYRTYDDDGEPVYLHIACVKDGHRWRCAAAVWRRDRAGELVAGDGRRAAERAPEEDAAERRVREIVNVVVSVIIAVIFGNPMAMISAVAGPDGLLRGLFEEPPAKLTHWAHPEHELTLAATAGAPFRCDGCQEPGGDGPRYRCAPCNFDLHTDCALPPATLQHPLLFKGGGCTFVFLREPPAPAAASRQCDACGDDVRGFVFHCADRDLDLHPCCASLEDRIVTGGGGDGDGRVFELTKAASSSSSRRRCGVCGDKSRRTFWFYRGRFDGEDVFIHVACVKELAVRRWEASYRRRSGAGQIALAGAPLMEGALQSLPRRTRRSGGFERFSKIVGVIVSAIIAVIFGNPMGLIAAVAGPDGLLRG
uniref:DC1 domain-containing protein n=1 Tax=Oryza barthii TaxID=65489 RepID=A0A0D3H023_9ORYZ